jgi:hypothetical protein
LVFLVLMADQRSAAAESSAESGRAWPAAVPELISELVPGLVRAPMVATPRVALLVVVGGQRINNL